VGDALNWVFRVLVSGMEVGPGARHCTPRHPTHFDPSFLALHGILRRGGHCVAGPATEGDQVVLNDKSRSPSAMETAGKQILLVTYPIYMIFILVNFLLSILQTHYREVHRQARGVRHVGDDITAAAGIVYKWAVDRYNGGDPTASQSRLSTDDLVKLFKNEKLSRVELGRAWQTLLATSSNAILVLMS